MQYWILLLYMRYWVLLLYMRYWLLLLYMRVWMWIILQCFSAVTANTPWKFSFPLKTQRKKPQIKTFLVIDDELGGGVLQVWSCFLVLLLCLGVGSLVSTMMIIVTRITVYCFSRYRTAPAAAPHPLRQPASTHAATLGLLPSPGTHDTPDSSLLCPSLQPSHPV